MGYELWLLAIFVWMLMAFTPIIFIIALLLLLIGTSNIKSGYETSGSILLKIGGFLLKSIVLLWLIPLLWLSLGTLFKGEYLLIIPVSVFLFAVVARIFFKSSGDKKENEEPIANEEDKNKNPIIRPSLLKLAVIVFLSFTALLIISYILQSI